MTRTAYAPPAYPRPDHPVLARHYDRALKAGAQVRYADDTTLTIWEQPRTGGLVILLFWILVIVSFGLALLLGVMSALDTSGTLTTHTVKPNGNVKTTVKRGVK